MTVCDITQFWSPFSGGVRRYVAEKIRYLRERVPGGRHLLIIPGARDEVSGDDTARTYTIGSPAVSRITGYRVLLRLHEIERILAVERPDIVECGDPYQVGWRTAGACERLGIPAVAFYHSHFAESELRPLGKWLGSRGTELLIDLAGRHCGRLYNRFARTLVPSPMLSRVLAGWGVRNTCDVDLGVDPVRFHPRDEPKEAIRRRLGIPAGARVLLSVGRLAAEKNTRGLCEAFRLLTARSPGEYHLLITGEGLQRDLVAQLRADTGAVTWLPFVSDAQELLGFYHAADLFVHPGVKETFGLVTLEAHACALPVVGIRGTAMDRVVCHTQSFWAAVNTPDALADAVARAFGHDLPALGAAAVLARFTWREVFARMFDVHREVIQDYPRR
ncbi:MAG: glycosyltransferase [Chthoniobacteraceae bacterium]